MPEIFTVPVGLSSNAGTWNFNIDANGNLEIKSNSPDSGGEIRILLNDDTGEVAIGSSDDPATLDITSTVLLRDQNGINRVRLSSDGQRIELKNADGEIIGMLGGGGNVRSGSNGERGDMFLYPSAATDIFDNGQATIRANAESGDLTLGGNEKNGDILLRDGNDTNRVRLSSRGQRIEVMDSNGEIIGMLGGGGNLRAGSNSEAGDLFLYPAAATNIFDNGQATVRANAETGDLTLGGNGKNGDLFLRDGGGTNRVRLSSSGQRIEVMNREGEIIGMLGGGANVRSGSNGEVGDMFLYPSAATNIFDNGQATVRANADTADLILGGNEKQGDIFLRDRGGTNRVRLNASGQRLEVMNSDGEIIGMLGGAGNVRMGTNGENGNIYLYPTSATDIFDNADATIHLNGQSGDIILQNADCAEDFSVVDTEEAEPGSVMVLNDDGLLHLSERSYDKRVVGIVSGAGSYKPGIVLDRQAQTDEQDRSPIALMGKAFCKVVASRPIAVGDLLTTSDTPGHAMKIEDSVRAVGSVIGKALAPLDEGTGVIPVLVTLQ